MSETLVVNLYAGPGTGKSTTAAQLFALLKQDQVNCELVTEFAKDLTWEGRTKALSFQPYVAGKQMYRIWRLIGEVDVIITDSPIMLCGHIYGEEGVSDAFLQHVRDIHDSWDTLDVILQRNPNARPYNSKGRNQTQMEAQAIDFRIESVLQYCGIKYERIQVDQYDTAAAQIQLLVESRVENLVS